MDCFQFDVILSSLKELQEEKSRNEKILAEEYGKRKQLEAKLESAIAKHKTVTQKNVKMKETMKVAEMKVAQTQAQVKMYEQVNDERKQRIAELKQKIEDEERKRQVQLDGFEIQMKELTENIRTAWQQFGENTLETSLVQHKDRKATLSSDIDSKMLQLSELSEQVVQTESEKESNTVASIPTNTWKTVFEMFVKENEAAKDMLEKTRQSLGLEETREQHRLLTKELDELQTKIASITSGTSQNHEE